MTMSLRLYFFLKKTQHYVHDCEDYIAMQLYPMRFIDYDFYQPKHDIAVSVAGEGGLVPDLYGDYDEAKRHFPAFARSEGRWEHALFLNGTRVGGISGLLDSYDLDNNVLEHGKYLASLGFVTPDRERTSSDYAAHLRDTGVFNERRFHHALARNKIDFITPFCRLTGTSLDDFFAQTSYSYWQNLGGINATIVADDVFSDRYHVIVDGRKNKSAGCGYGLIDSQERKILRNYSVNVDWRNILEQYPIAQYYEWLRRLSLFDPNHCPIIECQLVNGAIYFLQYHIGRDFVGRSFKLQRTAGNGETEVVPLRGATPPEGIDIIIALSTPRTQGPFAPDHNGLLEPGLRGDTEDMQPPYRELAWRVMALSFANIIRPSANIFKESLRNMADGHAHKSQLFKPTVAVAGNFDDVLAGRQPAGNAVRIHITSDGERALVRYVETLESD